MPLVSRLRSFDPLVVALVSQTSFLAKTLPTYVEDALCTIPREEILDCWHMEVLSQLLDAWCLFVGKLLSVYVCKSLVEIS